MQSVHSTRLSRCFPSFNNKPSLSRTAMPSYFSKHSALFPLRKLSPPHRRRKTYLVTSALGDSVRLAVVLGHVSVDEVHDVGADGHREHSRQGRGLLSHALRREDGNYGTGRHGEGLGRVSSLLIPRQDDRRGSKKASSRPQKHLDVLRRHVCLGKWG